jgi:osmotically-inducible protein OsmY
MGKMRRLILTLTLTLSLLTPGLLGEGKDDDRIEDLVRVRLAGNRDTGGAGRIKVAVTGGAVVLTGKVDSEKQKAAAEKQAKKVKGVKSVVNQLEVEAK